MLAATPSPRMILAAGAGMLTVLLAQAPAQAQTADELQSQIEALNQQLQQLQRQQELLMEQLDAATEEPIIPDGVARSGNDDVTLEVYGQVNRGVLWAGDGEDSQTFFVDNDNSATRFGLEGTADVSDAVGFDMTIGANIEIGLESESSNDVEIGDQAPDGDDFGSDEFDPTLRKAEIFAQSDLIGNVWLGEGNTATQSIAEIDLSGTGVILESDIDDFADEIDFRADGFDIGDIGPGDAYSNLDGLSRDDRVRYDTPDLFGLQASVSTLTSGSTDVALRYERRIEGGGSFLDGTRLAAGVGYASDQRDEDATEQIVSGSASVRFPFGLNLTFAAGTSDIDGAAEEPNFYYGKIGYRETFFDNLGETRFGIDFAASQDFLTADGDSITDLATATDVAIVSDDLFSVGVGIVQRVDPAAMDLYIGYRYHSLDIELADGREPDVDAINAVLVGARVRF